MQGLGEWFQSHNGAIAAWGFGHIILKQASFQSHNGAIAAWTKFVMSCWLLEVSIPQWCDCCRLMAVKPPDLALVSIPQWCDCCSEHAAEAATLIAGFQSHNGAIAAMTRKQIIALISSFNPTMVRLLLRGAPNTDKVLVFQSHNGAIAAFCAEPFRNAKLFVSIPQWCDCCV